jgi:N-formylglutamate amidohydrolase
MDDALIHLHGPAQPQQPLVLDSPHSGRFFPPDFDAIADEHALRDGEDCFVDALWLPATARGVPLLAAGFARTYLDANRHAGDIDLDLVEGGHWPGDWRPSGKAALGKALVWRTLDDGRPVYARRLTVAELQGRIDRCHRPYHARLRALLDAAHARFGRVLHLNCHSMNAVAGAMGEGGAGRGRADIVLGDRDGSTCAPALTALVRDTLAARGYTVALNDPYKGVELVRAYADPAAGRHSLQLEVNKRLYMDEPTRTRHAGFERLQADLMHLVDVLLAAPDLGRPAR